MPAYIAKYHDVCKCLFITYNYFLVPWLFSFAILRNSELQRLLFSEYIITDSRKCSSFEKEVILSPMKIEIWEDLLTFISGKEKENIILGLKSHPFTTCPKRPLLSALVNFLEPSAHTVGYSTARMNTAGTWEICQGWAQSRLVIHWLVEKRIPWLEGDSDWKVKKVFVSKL